MSKQVSSILYIDDEKNNLDALFSALRRKYNVYLASSGEDGMKILANQPHIKVIITDQRMPGMTGVEFLDVIKEKYPKSIRILLTAYTDSDAIIDAVNLGKIYQFISKPWDSKKHLIFLEQAIEIYDLRVEREELIQSLQQERNLLAIRVTQRTQQLEEKNKELQSKNTMISLLLKEMHHRIINKLSSLRGFVGSQRRFQKDSKFVEILKSIENKITQLANIHQQLRYVEHTNNRVDLQRYFDQIGELLYEINKEKIDPCKIKISTHQIQLVQQQAFFLGFIIYELMTNSFKYAFKSVTNPQIEIYLEQSPEQVYVLHYKDNGVGLPDHIMQASYFESEPQNSIGLHIVRLICIINQGSFEILQAEGYNTGVYFKCEFTFTNQG